MIPSDRAALAHQTEAAASELTRYGGRVFNKNVLDLLWAISEINDDLWHLRSPQGIASAREALDRIEAAVVRRRSG